MNTITKIFALLFLLSIYFSCQDGDIIQSFSDDFNSHETFWKRNQITDSSRTLLVKDPLNEQNTTIKFTLYPSDINAGSRRNEFVLKMKEGIGYTVEYSFKFMFPISFFKQRDKKDWVMIHQWHDETPKGVYWRDYKEKTKPPFSIYIVLNPEGNYSIEIKYGLETKDIDEMQWVKFTHDLEPNKWYTFSNTVKWSLDSQDGFSIPKLNDQFLISANKHPEHKMIGNNMYNDTPNKFKMGLYGNQKSNDTISVFFDDFRYTLRKNIK